jgi:hypothetical protein
MRRLALALLFAGLAAGAFAEEAASITGLTAAQVVRKNVKARGGLEAWRKIQTMVWIGHMESANAPMPNMPFVLQQKRPNSTRFEINAMDQKTLRVFDGAQGWKTRANRDGRPELQPYTPQELKFAHEAQAIDGPLMDYEAKGNAITLAGVERVEGRKAYRVNVRLASGERQSVWIDAQNFLDIRYDRTSYNTAGTPGTVSVFYRNYQTVEGLRIPSTLEIGVGSGKPPDKMVIEKIALNPPLDARTFDKPGVPHRRNVAMMDSGPARAADSVSIDPSSPPVAASPDPGLESR